MHEPSPTSALPGGSPRDDATQARLHAGVASKGSDYRPRTRHLDADGRPKFTNRLILETSPYLLQHAHNPVDWYPWGDAAFERAKRENKPVLLSIGYSTCHWCHVMERESFEDLEIAAYINEHYIAVKVDREERPDVDDVYMTAVQMLTGRGGWPLTTILTPAREPFFAGTYFPPRDGARGQRRGFLGILKGLAESFAQQPDRVLARAAQVSRHLAQRSTTAPDDAGIPGDDAIRRIVAGIASRYDETWGGFGSAPKFPRPVVHQLLLRHGRRANDRRSVAMVAATLRHMAAGGIRDHIGGGFHRYSTDRRWLVPHFEKMLYDNAQLAVAYVHAWQATQDSQLAAIAIETLDYLRRDMRAPDGGFYSATDADSPVPGRADDHEEGLFFTWSPAELAQVLDTAELAAVVAYYGVTDAGHYEGRNILHIPRPAEDVAKTLDQSPRQLQATIASAREKLYAARSHRPPPLRDEKVLTSWNGLAVSAFAIAGFALDRPEYVEQAAQTARFLLTKLRDRDGRLLRSYNERTARHPAVLDDYAFLIAGLLDLYEASSDPQWLRDALALQQQQDRDFLDAAAGGYFLTGKDAERLLVRQKPDYDGAEPSGNSVAAHNLLRLAELTGRDGLRRTAERLLASQSAALNQRGIAVPLLAAALDFQQDRPLQVFIVSREAADAKALTDELRRQYLPNRVISIVTESDINDRLALVPGLEDKRARGGRATAYVCEQQVCQKPTVDSNELLRQLERVTPYTDQ
ncbi:MAG: thioredoxin domain-containing protein [Myxococcales bacterium FL481]|nr:MAG: thioredoxin domain-containing protein [Myxococcales bacterium FL481]